MSTENKPTLDLAGAQKRIAELEGDLASANKKLEGVNDTERAILKKMSLGLTREQAIATIARQAKFPEGVKKVTDQNREANKKKGK